MTTAVEMQVKVAKFETNMGRADQWINGEEGETVGIDGGRSIKNLATLEQEAQIEIAEATDAADRAAVSAATAESVVGPTYGSVAEGRDATAEGGSFAVDNGDDTVSIYRKVSGVAVFQRKLFTTDAATGTGGAALLGSDDGASGAKWGNVQGFIDYLKSAPGAAELGLAQGGRVQQGIKYVTPEMKGAVSGVDQTAILAAWAAEANARGWEMVIPKGSSYTHNGLLLPENSVLKGEGTLVHMNNRLTLSNGCKVEGIKINGNGKTGSSDGIRIHDAQDCVVRGVEFSELAYSAITLSNANGVLIEDCRFSDIGDPDAPFWFASSSGMAVYIQNSRFVAVQRNPLAEQIYGTGAYFIGDNCIEVSVDDNYIQDTFYRGVLTFGGGHRRIVIRRNQIYRAGGINDTTSGVGCNGVYIATDSGDPSNIEVSDNIIEDVAENGIESLGASRIKGNKIKNTGYRALATPSDEGIFVESNCICIENTVVSAAFHGIRQFSDGAAATNIIIKDNILIACVGDGINMQANGAGASYVNCQVTSNNIVSFGGSFAVAVGGTTGGVAGASNIVAHNVSVSGATVSVAEDIREYGNSWEL